jgi:cardiolipin synthase
MTLQAAWFVFVMWRLKAHFPWVAAFTRIASMALVLKLYWKRTNAANKMPWMILIMAFPVLGLSMYFLLGRSQLTKKKRIRFENIDAELFPKLQQDPNVIADLKQMDTGVANQAGYIWNYAHFPIYQNTDVLFFDDAAKGLESQIQAIREAKHFIFMEYHAIEDAQSFQSVKEILFEKASQGVEVRIVYDDVGSISFIGPEFGRQMEAHGIQCRVFNPLAPVLNPFLNNRDHRKITVVDGEVGFTGGYNMTDEYFNLVHPYGHWKDTGVRLAGDGVQNLTVIFLEMWNAIKKSDEDYDIYLKPCEYHASGQGFVQPYADSPMDRELTGENVYMNMIKSAREYIYFMTPYLIISDEMARELELAAKRGVDVRIITPGIADKKLIYQVTRSYYATLLQAGVRIFEYTPGFCHGKQCVCDGETAVVGTINLDYRSLYLHFENAVFLYHCEAIQKIKEDFERTFLLCREVVDIEKSTSVRMKQEFLRLFAPLM